MTIAHILNFEKLNKIKEKCMKTLYCDFRIYFDTCVILSLLKIQRIFQI